MCSDFDWNQVHESQVFADEIGKKQSLVEASAAASEVAHDDVVALWSVPPATCNYTAPTSIMHPYM